MVKYTFVFFVAFAENRGGACLSESDAYKNLKSRLLFRCSNGHIFEKLANTLVYKKSWCEICSNRDVAHTTEFVREFIKSKGGELLTTEYRNARQKLDVVCEKGHLWHPRFHNLLHKNSWCPFCADERRVSTITTYNRKMIKKSIASK